MRTMYKASKYSIGQQSQNKDDFTCQLHVENEISAAADSEMLMKELKNPIQIEREATLYGNIKSSKCHITSAVAYNNGTQV